MKEANVLINPFYFHILEKITRHLPAPECKYQKRFLDPSAIFCAEWYEGLFGTTSKPKVPALIQDQHESAPGECKESTQMPKSAKQKQESVRENQ